MKRGRGGPLRRAGNPAKGPGATPVAPSDRARPGGGRPRDSDVSICSSRPSSVGAYSSGAPATSTLSSAAMIRSVNSYLASHSFPTALKPPFPSARDITDTVRFVLSRLDYPASCPSDRLLEDEFPNVLKSLGCPFKINKSALKAPGTPHAWPSFLAALHWLVQVAQYADHINSSSSDFATQDSDVLQYATQSYSLFISGDDDAVEALDEDRLRMAQQQADDATATVESLEKEAADLERKLEAMRSGRTPRQTLEEDRANLLNDVEKFKAVVDSIKRKAAAMEEDLAAKEKELEVKEGENRRVCEENNELMRRIDSQAVNVWDMERMEKELQAVEKDIAEAEMGRNALEEKTLELDASIRRKYMELVSMTDKCNETIKKLKIGNDFQYILNAEGSSPYEVLGNNYKSVLKLALKALGEDTKKSHVTKMEEKIALQQQSQDAATALKEKRENLASIQAKIEEAVARSNLLKKETEDHASFCESEAKRISSEVEGRMRQLETVEKEAEEFLKISEQKLEDSIRKSDEEIQKCAVDLLALIDLVSGDKEYVESKITGMREDLSETARTVAEAHKASLSSKVAAAGTGSSYIGSKRARIPSAS